MAEAGNPQTVIVADTNTAQFVLPLLVNESKVAAAAQVITVKSGDANKNLEELTGLWKKLSDMESTRSTLVVNLGGGVVSDMGGFAAATFKRGMKCINIPTTLLAAVDASVGGKTGINFNGLKNQIARGSHYLHNIFQYPAGAADTLGLCRNAQAWLARKSGSTWQTSCFESGISHA